MQLAESRTDSLIDVPEAPVGVPEAFEDHATLMFDLLAIAFEADLTRVSAFMLTRELSQRTYPNHRRHRAAPHDLAPRQQAAADRGARQGEPLPRRPASPASWSGWRPRQTATARCSITRSSSTAAAWATATCTPPTTCRRCSSAAAAGSVKGNRHIVAPELTPNGNLLVSVAEKFGVNMDSFGSSTGRIAL